MGSQWVQFDDYQLDLDTGDLVDGTGPVGLQPLPARLLALLVSRAGSIVTRDEIKQRIWGETTFAADQALNTAIHQIRIALGDSATEPNFLATVPRRGYRFIAALRPSTGPSPLVEAMEAAPTGAVTSTRAEGLVDSRLRLPLILALTAAILGGIFFGVGPSDGARGEPDATGAHGVAEALPTDVRLEYLKARELLDGVDRTSWTNAATAFDRVRERLPDFGPATSGAAHAALRLGEHERAAGLATWALAADSLDGEAHMILGTTLLQRGAWEEARKVLERARSLAPAQVASYTGLATVAALEGRVDRAMQFVEQALEVDPMSAVTLGDAGYVALWVGRPEQALEWCGHALDVRPGWSTPRYCLLDAHHALGQAEAERRQAVEIMRALDAAPSALQRVESSPAAEGLRRYRAWQMNRLDPTGAEPPDLAGYLAFLHMQDGDAEAALRLLEMAEATDPARFRLTLLDPVFDPLRDDLSFRRPGSGTAR